MGRTKNRKAKDRARRAKLRTRLEAAGVDPQTIEHVIAARREEDRRLRLASATGPTSREQILAHTDDSLWPDDTGFRPSRRDPLLHGAGRVQGVAAKVVKKGETVTRWQHNRMTDGTRETP